MGSGDHEAAAARRFQLVKWYFDCASNDGRVVIGYWASLAWRSLALTWQSVVLYRPGEEPTRRSSLGASAAPEVGDASIAWSAPALGCALGVERLQPAVGSRLLEHRGGVVDWRAEAPAAMVSVQAQGLARFTGPGYAECLRLTIPPWRLPIRELRWGRWIDESLRRSVVWIGWRGVCARTWVFVDGKPAASAEVTDAGAAAGSARLMLGEGRPLEASSFAGIAETIPPLTALVPKALLRLRQTRWYSPATLREGSRSTSGRAVHEIAVFR